MPAKPKHRAMDMLKEGLSPSQIAKKMGESFEKVMFYLFDQVAKGRIRRSDIVFSIPQEIRQKAEDELSKSPTVSAGKLSSKLRSSGDPEKEV